jgi:hypothetical protein
MHICFFGGINHYFKKKEKLYRWALHFFSFLFGLVMCHEPQTWGPMATEKKFIIYCMHIDFIQLSSSNHWILGLTLIQNELWVPKYYHAHSNVLFLMFSVSKKCHQDFNLLRTYYTCYTSLFGWKMVHS